MKLGMVGLGKMGFNMTLRLLRDSHHVVVNNKTDEKIKEAVAEGAVASTSYADLVAKLEAPRVVWLMIPAGDVTNNAVQEFLRLLSPGDLLIDGGNSRWTDSVANHKQCAEKGVKFLDVGVSGGIWGLTVGYCQMAGGEPDAFAMVEPAIKSLAPPDGYLHVGPAGAGHYSKMIHNGIEYGMMEAYAEGFEILKASDFHYDLAALSHLWNQGSVVRSWLLELAENAFREDPDLSKLRGFVEDSGEGRWTVFEAINRDVPAPVLTMSLFARFVSRQDESFAAKVLAALRNQFGGHAVKSTNPE